MSPRRGWPEGPDEVSAELRRALDEAALRGPDDMMLRRGWSAVSLSLGGKRKAREMAHDAAYDAGSLGEPPALDMAALMAPSRARRGFWFAWGVATTAALAAVGAVWLWPRVSELAQPGAQHHRAVAKNEVLAPGARRLTLEGGVEAVLGQSSVMRIEDGAPRVEGGEVRFSVPHRQPGHPFVVHAEGYRVVVVGTKFGVNVAGKDGTVGAGNLDGKTDKVAVDVDEGVVEVWEKATGQRLARLTPGERWQSPDAAPEPPAPPAPIEPAPEPAPSAAPPAAPEPPHTHRASKHLGGRTLALASPGEGSPTGDRAASDAGAAAARAALAAGDPNRALQLYKTLAQGTGPSAENASYEIGKVLSEKMGQPQSAVAAWRQYRAAHPDGILRVEADVSIIETLGRIGESDEALSEANEFLRRHPDSERRAEIARLAGDLYRAHGDCRRALGAYQIALGATRPRDAVEAAAFHRADCLVRLGDPGGPDAARAYLRAYPSGKFRTEATALASGSAPRP